MVHLEEHSRDFCSNLQFESVIQWLGTERTQWGVKRGVKGFENGKPVLMLNRFNNSAGGSLPAPSTTIEGKRYNKEKEMNEVDSDEEGKNSVKFIHFVFANSISRRSKNLLSKVAICEWCTKILMFFFLQWERREEKHNFLFNFSPIQKKNNGAADRR
jgi:hypothetical protein